MKRIKKNKKGFTLIEIIVVLVIIGIMIALAAPAVLGYVDKAKESQAMSEGRAGYLAAQTILVREKAKGISNIPNDSSLDKELAKKVNEAAAMKDALGTDSSSIVSYVCAVSTTNEISTCSFKTKSSGAKFVNVEANKDTTVDATQKTTGTLVEVTATTNP